MELKYTKEEAIKTANNFMFEVNKLENRYNMSFNSDSGDIYLSYKTKDKLFKVWDTIDLGWDGRGTGIKVIETYNDDNKIREIALSKLSDREKEVLGLM